MDIDKIRESLGSAIPQVAPYAVQHQKQAEDAAEFARITESLWHMHNLESAYSLEEVMQACKMVCMQYADPSLRTLKILTGRLDAGVTRRFFSELVSLTQ